MLYSVIGQTESILSNSIILKVEHLSYEINVIDPSSFPLNEKIKLYIHDYIKDESILLYGFKRELEKRIFSVLIKISGIGPLTAKSILKKCDCNRIISYVNEYDVEEFAKATGTGVKAEHIIRELKRNLGEVVIRDMRYKEVYDMLIGIGYSAYEVNEALEKLEDNLDISKAFLTAAEYIKDGRRKNWF